MKKEIILGLFCILFLVGVYFHLENYQQNIHPEEEGEEYVTGNIYDINKDSILVAEGFDEEDDPIGYTGKAGTFTVGEQTLIVEQNGEPVDFESLSQGDMVTVWVEGPVKESYPVQGTASMIKVVKTSNSEDENYEEDREREEAECFIGGCSGEICSRDEDAVSTCEILPGMECLDKGMSCQFLEGDCKWVLSKEAANCFVSIKNERGDYVTETRIGYLFEQAQEFMDEGTE